MKLVYMNHSFMRIAPHFSLQKIRIHIYYNISESFWLLYFANFLDFSHKTKDFQKSTSFFETNVL